MFTNSKIYYRKNTGFMFQNRYILVTILLIKPLPLKQLDN